MEHLFVTCAILFALYYVYHRWTRISVADIPGPKANSFLLGELLVRPYQAPFANFKVPGHQAEVFQSQAAETDFKWQAEFGGVIRVKGILGTDRLLVSDPKALHHIFASGYNIRKTDFRLEGTRILTGPGLGYADGENHHRQRKINSPAFGMAQTRSYVPIYLAYANLCTEWKERLGGDTSIVVDTPSYFTRFFLDVIGEVAFDYQFGATDNANDPLAAILSSVVPKFTTPSKFDIFVLGLLELAPVPLLLAFMRYAPTKGFRNSRHVERVATAVAKRLVEEKSEALMAGKSKRDIMSLLVKANASADPRSNLSANELYAQMQTIMQAGHETTATTMSWTILELTRHPEVQAKLRAEIQAAQRIIHERGDTELTAADFDSMAYTVAVMKETLRFHPVVFNTLRGAARDEVLPLSKPIVTLSGKTITELPIPKNQILVTSIAGYNRNTDVFGQDAQQFNPERWLDGTVKPAANVGIGMFANLMTFGSGHRGCIGWRFAIYEYQAFLTELVKNFEFSMDPTIQVRREPGLVIKTEQDLKIGKGFESKEREEKKTGNIQTLREDREDHESMKMPLRVVPLDQM
ncbi:cytochrome P450 [Mycena metata]|uniref:Cytochrome P450 n=1 Tax=Mycena metata TaxID=1033252 RepID=A0AAD7J166_9AGAR|nr:cytochrome P450 [Mycena metata]